MKQDLLESLDLSQWWSLLDIITRVVHSFTICKNFKRLKFIDINTSPSNLLDNVLDSGASGPGSSVMFLGKTLLSRRLSTPRCINVHR